MSFYVLIDYENLQTPIGFSLDEEREDKNFKLVFFIGSSQGSPPSSYREKLYDSFGQDNVDLVQVHDKGPNALDFILSGFLGLYAERDPKAQFWIVSGDNGFDPLISHFKGELKFDVQRAYSIQDLVHKLSPLLKLCPLSQLESTYEQSSQPMAFQMNVLCKIYATHLFSFLKKSDTNLRYWKRSRQEVEEDLVKNIPNYWVDYPKLVCDRELLPEIIHSVMGQLIKEHFIMEDENGKLCYFIKDNELVEPAKHYITGLAFKPKHKEALINSLHQFAKKCKLDDSDAFCEKMLESLQDKVFWIRGESVSFESEQDAIQLSLKYSFFKSMPNKLKVNPPQTMSALITLLRAEGISYQITKDDIFAFIQQLVNTKKLSYKDDDLTWHMYQPRKAFNPAMHSYAVQQQYRPKNDINPADPNYYWSKTLQYVKLPNRPTTYKKLMAFLLNNFKTSQQHVQNLVERLEREGYFTTMPLEGGDFGLIYS